MDNIFNAMPGSQQAKVSAVFHLIDEYAEGKLEAGFVVPKSYWLMIAAQLGGMPEGVPEETLSNIVEAVSMVCLYMLTKEVAAGGRTVLHEALEDIYGMSLKAERISKE